jgi:hypothetical protein
VNSLLYCEQLAGYEQDQLPFSAFCGLFSSLSLPSFSTLCTKQYKCHCVFTLDLPRSVSRFSCLVCRMFANTGSTVPTRWLYRCRPCELSIACFINSVAALSGSAAPDCQLSAHTGQQRVVSEHQVLVLRWCYCLADFATVFCLPSGANLSVR